MTKTRLTAHPMREAIYLNSSKKWCTAWIDYRWNTGKVSRRWFVDPKVIEDVQLTIKNIEEIGKL